MSNRYTSAAAAVAFFVLATPADPEGGSAVRDRPPTWHIVPPPEPVPPPGSPGDCVLKLMPERPHDYPNPDAFERWGPNMIVGTLLNAYARKDVAALGQSLAEGFRFDSDDPDFRSAFPSGFSRNDEIESAGHLFADADSIRIHVGSWSGCRVSVEFAQVATPYGKGPLRWPALGGRVLLQDVTLCVWLRNGTRIVTGPATDEFVVVRANRLPAAAFDRTVKERMHDLDVTYRVARWTEHVPAAAEPKRGEPDSTMLAHGAHDSPPAELALRPLESPARGALRLALALPTREPARVEMYDVAGRRVSAWEIPSGPARTVNLTPDDATPAGVYWLRLAQGTRVARAHVVLLK